MTVVSQQQWRKFLTLYMEGQISKEALSRAMEGVVKDDLPNRVGEEPHGS